MKERYGSIHVIRRVPRTRKHQVGEVLEYGTPALQILVGGDIPPVLLPWP
jgi:hypothetical protein